MTWAPDYITADQFKSYAHIEGTDDDTEIATAITAASRAIDRACGRQFGKVASAEARRYTARWDRRRKRWVIPIDDLMDTTGLVVTTVDDDGTVTGTITAYDLEPRNAAAESKPWELLVIRNTSTVVPTGTEYEMDITAPWGWTSVQDTIVNACKLQTSRFHERRDSPWGIAGSPDSGSEVRLLAKVDPDVDLMLGDYRRRWGAV